MAAIQRALQSTATVLRPTSRGKRCVVLCTAVSEAARAQSALIKYAKLVLPQPRKNSATPCQPLNDRKLIRKRVTRRVR
eukprot:403225-Pleurochrysis_carterae.AAC.1